ncbi:small ubiquitin modifier 2 [Thecamonas trahens ATCC 50062]|uniref:Small ubiquitin modifier 2 n=1 Tax=Thecamonas trahens ATCC 50062 TaxID=461836 RepID=A0A0L0D6E2_THETB|nr:small ubiquitin modifier 2 [Thecamonas trahens ATCC 50062]KNC46883.1 small ubiquitin modifier 2 [Thecamonas trahens ATCC 50062]|eukprot:XP_013760156.1 small ubiquitin modifier 2 [Thecamonas trahens ATCC 50062]
MSDPAPAPESKPKVKDDTAGATEASNHIQIHVVSQSGDDVFFKIKRNTPLSKLMRAYCSRAGVDISAVRFMFDGSRVREDMTAEQLEMEDGDEIDVMAEQVGGQ